MKIISLSANHYFLSASQEVRQFCQSLLARYHINMFAYGRYYTDQSCILLSDNSDWLSYHLAQGYLVPAPIPAYLLEKSEAYHVIPNDGPFKQAKYDLIKKYHTDQAVDFIFKHENYYEVICFSFALYCKEAINILFNQLDYFKQFILSFKDQYAPLIKMAAQHTIVLPPSMIGIHHEKEGNKTFIKHNNIIFSKRENEILYFLLRGKTAREIATILGLSRRTIEHYIENIKIKTQSSSKSELISKMIDLNEHSRFLFN